MTTGRRFRPATRAGRFAVNASAGYLVSLRPLNYEGPETYCDATGNCATRKVSLTTGPGFDSMTGMGSVNSRFIPTISRF